MKAFFSVVFFLAFTPFYTLAQIYARAVERLPYMDTSKKIASLKQTSYRPVMANGKLENGEAIERIVYYYDAYGNLAKRVIEQPVLNGHYHLSNRPGELAILPRTYNDTAVAIGEYQYDKRGNLMAMEHDPVAYSISARFKYNDKDQLVELSQLDLKGAFNFNQFYKYNDAGQLIEADLRDLRNKPVTKTYYKYDAEGKKIEEYSADSTKAIAYHWKLTYDSLTQKVSGMLVTGYNASPHKQKYRYEYDAQGRKEKIYLTVGDSTRLYSVYKYTGPGEDAYTSTEYNTSGTIVQTVSKYQKKRDVLEDGQLSNSTELRYDKHNNLIYQLHIEYPDPRQTSKTAKPLFTLIVNEIKYR